MSPVRDLPILYPDYFLELLSTGGVAATPGNVAELIERTAFMIGTQGAAYCAQLRDPAAFEVFVRNFARGAIPGRDLQLVDDMVDWLWVWNPGCHDDLRTRFTKWRTGLLAPNSFLERGRDIPPWSDTPDGRPDHEEAWRLVYADSAR